MSEKIIAFLLASVMFFALLCVSASCEETTAVAESAVSETQIAENAEAASGDVESTVISAESAETSEIAETSSADAAESKDHPVPLVILMGLGVVFFGLICIIALCMIMSKIVQKIEAKFPERSDEKAPAAKSAAPDATDLSPEKRREVIAAISAVIAEELGTDVSAICVTSFRKI